MSGLHESLEQVIADFEHQQRLAGLEKDRYTHSPRSEAQAMLRAYQNELLVYDLVIGRLKRIMSDNIRKRGHFDDLS